MIHSLAGESNRLHIHESLRLLGTLCSHCRSTSSAVGTEGDRSGAASKRTRSRSHAPSASSSSDSGHASRERHIQQRISRSTLPRYESQGGFIQKERIGQAGPRRPTRIMHLLIKCQLPKNQDAFFLIYEDNSYFQYRIIVCCTGCASTSHLLCVKYSSRVIPEKPNGRLSSTMIRKQIFATFEWRT